MEIISLKNMKVNLGQAVNMFFGNSSLEMVYFEAIANALDADATQININFSIEAFNRPSTFKLQISDNGVGFTDTRYQKFAKLFDVDEGSHKGLGRLVYLCYFEKVEITSYYNRIFKRDFSFSEGFEEKKFHIEKVKERPSGTILNMSGYSLTKIAKNDFVNPNKIKYRILEEFYARLFQLKKEKVSLVINIKGTVDGKELSASINDSDIPEFTMIELEDKISLFDKLDLYYSIKKVECTNSSLIAAITVDQRTVKVNLISDENLPHGYEMVFLLYSDYFKGKIDATRQNLTISPQDLNKIQLIFRKNVISLIEKAIPNLRHRNLEVKNGLIDKYPHLSGYFDSQAIGYLSRTDILKRAQDQFFKEQRDILDTKSLSDEQFEKSIELSSRALTEYILFRQFIIEKLKSINKKDLEEKIHNIIVPQRKVFRNNNHTEEIYQNCSWILDEKFMTYSVVLSEKEMSDLITEITKDEVVRDEDRPDIAIIFSGNPQKTEKVEVVIVELKKKGLKPEENVKVEVQLEKRARKLFDLYPGKIQRLWLYGITELDNEYKSHLSTAGYHPLYSKGTVFVNTTDITVNWETGLRVPAVRYIMDFDALVNDADARNHTFLSLIKSKFTHEVVVEVGK